MSRRFSIFQDHERQKVFLDKSLRSLITINTIGLVYFILIPIMEA